jgi:hypothetical protein
VDESFAWTQFWCVIIALLAVKRSACKRYAAPCTFRHEGRIADLRCKCELGVSQQRELTFTLPKNSVFFCTAARRLGAQSTFFLQCSKCLLQSNGSRFVSLNSEIRMRVGFWIWHRMEWTQRYDIVPRSAKVALAAVNQ